MSDTPETDAAWRYPARKDFLEHARKLERQRDAARAREAAIREFCHAEMSWEFFRAECKIGDSPSQSLKNARKLQEFLAANT
jgi:hypothetical protein